MRDALIVYCDITLVTGFAKIFHRLRLFQFGSLSLSLPFSLNNYPHPTPPGPTHRTFHLRRQQIRFKRGLLTAAVCHVRTWHKCQPHGRPVSRYQRTI